MIPQESPGIPVRRKLPRIAGLECPFAYYTTDFYVMTARLRRGAVDVDLACSAVDGGLMRTCPRKALVTEFAAALQRLLAPP